MYIMMATLEKLRERLRRRGGPERSLAWAPIHPEIFKYPVHVLKTERSVATKDYFEMFPFAHVVKTELSAGTGPRGGWA